MINDKLKVAARTYQRLVEEILLASYSDKQLLTKRFRDFEYLALIEQGDPISTPDDYQKVQRRVAKLLARSLIRFGETPVYHQHKGQLLELSKAVLVASSSTELLTLMEQASRIVYGPKSGEQDARLD